jgi:hypothetical protein
MIGTIRKHQTWLWTVIIAAIIIAFVWYFSPYTKMNGPDRRRADHGSINGIPITEEEFVQAVRETNLRYFFMSGGRWPTDPEAMGREAYPWLLLIQKQEQMGIHLNTDAVADAARNLLAQLQRSGTSPEAFLRQVRHEDFERYVQHAIGLQELIGVFGLGGRLLTPQEAKDLYTHEHEELASEIVFFSASNHLAGIAAPPEAVSEFYTNHQAEYRVPERVQVSYVKFGVSNFLAESEAEWAKTNLTEVVDNYQQRLGTNFYRDAKSPAESKAKIREDLVRDRAMGLARKKAMEFAGPLLDIDPPHREDFDKLAKTNGLTVSVTAPFSQREGPKEIEVGEDFVKAAFSRTPEEPFARPLSGQDGVYVIAFDKKLPSEVPPLEKIREQVTENYRYIQALSAARKAGAAFYQTLTNGLAQGKTFSALCAEAKVKAIELPPFSRSTRALPEVEDHVNLEGRVIRQGFKEPGFKDFAFATPPGTTSPFQMTSDGGMILHVKARLPVDQAKLNADLPAFVNYERQRRQESAFDTWFRKEMEKGLRETPYFQQRQPPPAAAGAAKS